MWGVLLTEYSKFKSEKNKNENKEQLTIFPRHMRIFRIWKVEEKGRKVAPTNLTLISSMGDAQTDKPILIISF